MRWQVWGALFLFSSWAQGVAAQPEPPAARAEPDGSRDQEPRQKAAEAAPQPPQKPADGIWPAHRELLNSLLAAVGATDADMKLMARSPERQTRIMYDLALSDLAGARAMYCSAGDAVLEHFDPKTGREQNLAAMQAELLAQLPAAREIGCLDHIANNDVYAVDVDATSVALDRHATLAANAANAVQAGQLKRFRAPPSHRGAFHFEFSMSPPERPSAADDKPTAPKANTPPDRAAEPAPKRGTHAAPSQPAPTAKAPAPPQAAPPANAPAPPPPAPTASEKPAPQPKPAPSR